jgi:hypothetical protein
MLLICTACTNSLTSQDWERSLAADPQLQNNPGVLGNPTNSPQPTPSDQVKLPADFPSEIPRYPNATLQSVQSTPDNQGVLTQWSSVDRSDRVINFYNQALQSGNWQIERRPEDDAQGTFVARRQQLQVTIAIQPPSGQPSPTSAPQAPAATPTPASTTQFSIQVNSQVSQATRSGTANTTPQPGDPEFIGPVASSGTTPQTSSPTSTPGSTLTTSQASDLNQAPSELQPAIADLLALGVLSSSNTTRFEPNQPITRREFARWLLTANNLIYTSRPAQKIRPAANTAQASFRDIPNADPDFGVIQGLAEAGLIPSALSGDSATVLFRPNAPLTRETLMQWKVPLDLRQPLPLTTVDAVQQRWGFKDAARVDPMALRAILADYQNGDLSNIRRVFGFTTLFQPKKPVTRAEAAAALWYFGMQGEGLSAKEALQSDRQPTPAAAQPNTASSGKATQ